MKEVREIAKYKVTADDIVAEVRIIEAKGEFVRLYELRSPKFGAGTHALLESIRGALVAEVPVGMEKVLDIQYLQKLKKKFRRKAKEMLDKELPSLSETAKRNMVGILVQELLGLGILEFLLSDGNLEEIVINSAREPVWVYHRKFGWLKTNIVIESEDRIRNFASIVGRRVGKQISILNPLLDAHLITGDRANATLFPISSFGNTFTVRRFRREPWTVTDFIKNKTVNAEVMAIVWQAFQFELSVIISGGTASGKTTMLNVCMPFIQPNQRIISIEETRELTLPTYLHWVPLTTREPNPEGRGGVAMLDLMVNSLRMRPDRLVVGEVRRENEVEVLFEAMLTGHSGYTTVHANTAEQTIRRITTPPMSLPISLLAAAHLAVVMFRNRRLGTRNLLELAEFVPRRRGEEETVAANILYRYRPTLNKIVKANDSVRITEELQLHTGLTQRELEKDVAGKKKILEWMVKKKIHRIEEVGSVIADYYLDPDRVLALVEKGKPVVK